MILFGESSFQVSSLGGSLARIQLDDSSLSLSQLQNGYTSIEGDVKLLITAGDMKRTFNLARLGLIAVQDQEACDDGVDSSRLWKCMRRITCAEGYTGPFCEMRCSAECTSCENARCTACVDGYFLNAENNCEGNVM